MRSRFFHGLSADGFHRLHYLEWGESRGGVPVVCVHGLSQNARTFDEVGRALSLDRWVVCLDVVGRGASDWLANGAHYDYAQYLADVNTLVARLDVDEIDWIGTSMGGLIGIMFAAISAAPVRAMVINDVGPFIPKAATDRIKSYTGNTTEFADLDAVVAYYKRHYAPFGPLTDEQWRTMAGHATVANDDGTRRLRMDPEVGAALRRTPAADVNLWPFWDRVEAPVLLLRGAESDLLPAATAAEMRSRGPATELVEFAGIGHAPALLEPGQIGPIVDFLGDD